MQRMGKGGDTYYLCSKQEKAEKSMPLMCRQMH